MNDAVFSSFCEWYLLSWPVDVGKLDCGWHVKCFLQPNCVRERWKGRREREGRGGEVGGRGGEKMRSRRYEGRREGRGGDEGEEGIFANIRHWHYEYHYTISPSPYCVYWVQSGLIDGFLSISDNTTKRAPFSLLHKGSSVSRPWQIAQAHNTSM